MDETQFNPISSIEELQQLVVSGETNWHQYGVVNTKEYDDLILFNYGTIFRPYHRWTFFERISRGLILNKHTGEVVARPFDKFWNWGEKGWKPKGDIKHVYAKEDGSLGILYRHNGEYCIATRGSFTSPQALRATKILQKNYGLTTLWDDWTLLFEIIYPENRIVVDL